MKRVTERQADCGSPSEKSAAKASRALEASAPRFFSHSAVTSKGERGAAGFLPRGFLVLRACRNCSCNGESFLINLAFFIIYSPSNRRLLKKSCAMERKSKGRLAKVVVRRASMRARMNFDSEILTLDFPTLPSLRNVSAPNHRAKTSQSASRAGEDAHRLRELEAWKAKRRRKVVSMSRANSRVYGRTSRQFSRNVRTRVLTVAFAASR